MSFKNQLKFITKSKIDIYIKFKGFYEGFHRKFNNNKKQPLSDDEWFLIDQLITETALILKKLTSEEFNRKLEEKLLQYCDDLETIQHLKKSSLKKLY